MFAIVSKISTLINLPTTNAVLAVQNEFPVAKHRSIIVTQFSTKFVIWRIVS